VEQEIKKEQSRLEETYSIIYKLYEEKKNVSARVPQDAVEEKVINNAKKEVQKLTDAKKTPYFGRLDFEDRYGKETIYIGKKGIEHDSELVVVDWRTDLGKLYNAYQGVQNKFQINDDPSSEVTIHKKRGINIKDGRVTKISDMGKTVIAEDEHGDTVKYMDDYLEEILTNTSEGHQLRDIVTSIQAEQDQIIRLPLNQSIIVQGAAGSGKSTIALHRISYLLYQLHGKIKPEKVLVLAPNEMFLSYISEIVPELDVEGIEQRTFYDWASHYFTDVRNISELHDDYVKVHNSVDRDELIKVSKYKGSLQFKKLLDDFVNYIGQTMIPHRDIVIDADTILSKEEIDRFYKGKKYLPLNLRMRDMKKYLQSWGRDQIKLQQSRIDEEFEEAYQKWIVSLPEGDERKQVYEALEKAKDLRLKLFKDKVTTEINTYVRKMEDIPAVKMYKSVFQKRVFYTFTPNMEESLLSLLLKNGREIKKEKFSYEDIAPLIYLDAKINGKKLEYEHLVIDEAQDYSPFQLAIMKDYAKSMTILGDMAQGIFSFYGLDSWKEIGSYVFKQKEMKKLNLQTSYRSTKQIMDMANRVLLNSSYDFPLVIPVNRKGMEPVIKQVDSSGELYDEMSDRINKITASESKKIAIITDSRETAVDTYDQLQRRNVSGLQVISEGNQSLSSKIIIIPNFLVKGLEFDAVLIEDVSDRTFRDETLHAKMLYMTITRSHHELYMFYRGNLSPLLEKRDTNDPPKPRASFVDWLNTPVDDPGIVPEVQKERHFNLDESLILFEDEEKLQSTEYFTDDYERVNDFEAWLKVWHRWADYQKNKL
jgi:DNA helicase-2/ATP-dependent DNA helicase PcrA